MPLQVSAPNNPTLTGVGVANPGGRLVVAAPNNPLHITGVGVATPGSNGFASLVPTSSAGIKQATTTSASTTDALSRQISALMAQINANNQKVYAPALDTNAIYNQATTTANANVNPYYTKLLNDFIGQQSTARTLQQQSTATQIKNLQDIQKQIEEANATTGTRSAQDTALTESNINKVADQRQIDQGTAFNDARVAEAQKEAGSGLAGSGLAAGRQAKTEQTHLTTETRQAEADQQAKDAAELTKARTFEDLATSTTNAGVSEKKGETAANFDLNKFIVGQGIDLQNKQQDLEVQRQAAIQIERNNQTKLLVGNFINSIANPAQRQAAVQAYGGYI